MKLAKYGIVTALMLTLGAIALPGKAEAGSGVAIRAPGVSLYVGDGHRHYRKRHYYKRNYYRGRHHGYRNHYKKRYYHNRHHRYDRRHWR